MKIIALHSDFIEYKAVKEAIKNPPAADKELHKVEDCLVVFTAIEKQDEGHEDTVAKNAASEIKKIAGQVKADTVVIYPWVHLSSNPSSPGSAQSVLKLLNEKLKKEFKTVEQSPFGWYKQFEIKVKGHPLAELSREIKTVDVEDAKEDQEESQALKAEKKLVSHWHILDMNGTLHDISINDDKIKGFDFAGRKNLEKFTRYEMAKVRVAKEEPPHVKIMRDLELVDYEPGTDPGHFRYYPKGRLVKSLLEDLITKEVIDYGGMEVETPIMYDYEHPSLKAYLNRFPARQYSIQTPNKKVFLRFAACFGQFLMANHATISYKNLPMRLYELTRYSFRVEQRGELTGLRRLRAFSMPDCHAFCQDLEQAKQEMHARFDLAERIHSKIGFKLPDDFEFAIRTTKEFYNENKPHIMSLIEKWGKPALVEMWDEKFFYYNMKYEWNFVDALDKASALTTDQVDTENAKNYDITYIDTEGKAQNPLILHFSPGAVERIIYAMLEKIYMESQNNSKVPMLPIWLSPAQVRIIPVSEKQRDYAINLSEKFNNVRVDVDDRDEKLGKKIMQAGTEWVPRIVVIGDREVQDGTLTVTLRETGEKKQMSISELQNNIDEAMESRPFKALSLPKLLSKRPVFVG